MALVGSGLVGLSTPAAAAPAPGPDRDAPATSGASPAATDWQDPVAGMTAQIEFADAATSARAASLSPYLAEIVREAKQVRTVDIEPGSLNPSLAAESVSIELFDDVRIDLATNVALSEGVSAKGRSSRVYSAGGEDGSAIITIIGGDVHGALWQGTTKYGIDPLGGGRHLVYEEGRTFPEEAQPVAEDRGAAEPAPPATPADPAPPGTLATTVIDIMVAFDNAAEAIWGSVATAEAEIIERINTSNMVYANSQLDQELALTNIVDLNYAPNATDGTDSDQTYLTRIRTDTDGIVDNLHGARDANVADLVAVMSDLSQYCGIARLPTSSWPAEQDAFSLTDGACSDLTFTHEIGHNLCAHHDPDNVGGTNQCGADAYGHYSSAEALRTVMAYSNPCGSCTRIPYHSNPNVVYNGWTTGILGSRDNSRVIAENAPDIAAYRPAPPACEVDYTITSTWAGNVQVELAVTNNTPFTSTWTAEWTFTGDESVYNSWGVDISQAGADATVTGDGFGASIPGGGTVTVGFQATVTGTPTVPSPITCTT